MSEQMSELQQKLKIETITNIFVNLNKAETKKYININLKS